jgi:hypothetical protein
VRIAYSTAAEVGLHTQILAGMHAERYIRYAPRVGCYATVLLIHNRNIIIASKEPQKRRTRAKRKQQVLCVRAFGCIEYNRIDRSGIRNY